MYIEFNNNPTGRRVGDCVVRAVSKALDVKWENAYLQLAINGLQMGDMPSSDSVAGSVLRQHGFVRRAISDTCPDCYTVDDFCKEFPTGIYVLFFGGHTATVKDGNLYDAWDSSAESPQYYWTRERY